MITVLDVAIARGIKKDENGNYTASEFYRVGLPFMGGCLRCYASIAAYNAAPTKTGYLMCAKGCAEGSGFETVKDYEDWMEANAAMFEEWEEDHENEPDCDPRTGVPYGELT